MSMFGEEIIARLPPHSALHRQDNPGRKIIMNTIGEWLDRFEERDWMEQFFLQDATGKYLDLHGNDFGLPRKIDESDDDYRNRIIYESLGHLTTYFLKSVYNVELYVKVNDFEADTMLTSDNEYISSNGFMGVVDETTQEILEKKFVLGSGITWL
ncbi:hypothetical protein [Methanobrevibacter sp.]|uniref:hypothetical protein n=1 Tax=Methanobrevibacter sp. TaxID=66852 RepID=UPI0038907D8A